MSRIEISRRALADLDNIWEFIATDNIRAADETLDRIKVRCSSYANQPELGESRPEIGSDIRSFSVSWYVIYYRARNKGIEIVRVLHGARDVGQLF